MQLNVDSDLNGESPQFTLTCISTGGPATTVTWTRDSMPLDGGLTVLDNAMTAQYTHTLTVTGTLPGHYECTVSNNKPSTATRSFIVQGNVRIQYLSHNISAQRPGVIRYVSCSCRDWLVSQLYIHIIFTLQLPQLPLTSWQSKKVQLEFEFFGPHPLH